MLERMESKLGYVDIERPVAAKIIKETVMKHKEVFGITNLKGHRSSFLSKFAFDKNSDFIIIKKDKDEKIEIEINVVLFFGESISEVSNSIIKECRENLKEYIDLEPESISVHIVGLKSKKVIERNIYVRG